jgi:hypothetical protein
MTSYDFEQLKLSDCELIIFNATADGLIHKPEELCALIDELHERNNLRELIFRLRRKLLTVGQDIVFQSMGRGGGYRRVRLLKVNINE